MRTRASNSIGSPSPACRDLAASRALLERRQVERLLARRPSDSTCLAVRELQRQHAHPDQVRAVDALVGLGDHEAHAEQRGPLAAQSRDEPEPYSLPASTHSGAPSAYAIAAS